MSHKTHHWPEQGIRLRYFRTEEFDHPAEMDRDFLRLLDRLRHESGVGLIVTSDFRTEEENERIGGASNSAHLTGRAVDVQPIGGPSKKMRVIHKVLDLWMEGEWPRLGLGIYDIHLHLDSHPDEDIFRPTIWVGRSS